jgi:probable selenium-dependent hydroxylase accessory protein YqeC
MLKGTSPSMSQLSERVGLSSPIIALVGAGGKTTTMYTLARELIEREKRVVTTTTTQIYLPQPGETERLLVEAEMSRLLKNLQRGWRDCRHITVASAVIGSGKLKGLSAEQPAQLFQHGGADVVIVEADGARHLKIKAPADYEPVMPTQVSLVLLLLSAEALNQPLSGEIVHRPEVLARLTAIKAGDPLTPAVVARLLLHKQGGLKQVPDGAGVYVLITHATQERRESIAHLAELVREEPRVAGVYCSERPGEWQDCVAS